MADDDNSEPKRALANVNFNEIGKETDKAVAEILRKFLSRPAEEAGSLIADGLGIFGDRVRQKRLQNLELGFGKARADLEQRGVDLKDITPPEEEEAYLLVDGMSLSGDETVRSLWAGLLAEALDPSSVTIAERPFINVLEDLSPQDARIFDFLAFKERREKQLYEDIAASGQGAAMTTESDEYKLAVRRHTAETVSDIYAKADVCGIDNVSDGWSDNLFRIGIIERAVEPELENPRLPSAGFGSMDQGRVSKVISEAISQVVKGYNRSVERPKAIMANPTFKDYPSTTVRLSPFGRRLASACGLSHGSHRDD